MDLVITAYSIHYTKLYDDGQARETIHSNGQCGVDFHIRLRVASHDGTLREQDDALEIEGAGDIA